MNILESWYATKERDKDEEGEDEDEDENLGEDAHLHDLDRSSQRDAWRTGHFFLKPVESCEQ